MRSTEDVWAGVICLSKEDLLRLKLFAESCISALGPNASGRDENDLMSEAVVATATREQLWNDGTSLVAHLLDVIRQTSSAWGQSEGELLVGDVVRSLKSGWDRDMAAVDPERVCQAKEKLSRIRSLISDDADAAEVIELFALGYSAEEIQCERGMSQRKYCAIMSRIRQKLQRGFWESDDTGFEMSLSGILSEALSDIASAEIGR
jgi:hypothetical protein